MRRALILLSVVLLWVPTAAQAFCGFYVGGADAKLFNNATLVVMMRDGTRTVLSMQNNYQGPPEKFAMVVPVPVVLQKENVKTLPREIFARVDQLAAPRLVEYWEQDPCYVEPPHVYYKNAVPSAPAPTGSAAPRDLGVKIEAQFTVGEYEVVILSAQDSTGLDTWLHREGYHIPDGAEPILRPYVQGGMKFFVAKVNITKVQFANGQAMLSPLRFHYDSDAFNLPIRLGLVNSAGTQDLIVHILARGQRYEVANYENVTIPTNLDIDESAKDQFGPFYAALFDATLERHPKAVVTEYSWAASSCDPCPSPALNGGELLTLGADALPSLGSPNQRQNLSYGGDFVLTRLHARYTKQSLGDDLVFRAAPPIVGGREFMGQGGHLEKGATPSSMNNFQGRYAIRHLWTGPIACANPRRGIWGGPPGQGYRASAPPPRPALNLAFAPRGGVKLASMVREDVPELGLKAKKPTPKLPSHEGRVGNCAVSMAPRAGALAALAALVGAALFLRRKRA